MGIFEAAQGCRVFASHQQQVQFNIDMRTLAALPLLFGAMPALWRLRFLTWLALLVLLLRSILPLRWLRLVASGVLLARHARGLDVHPGDACSHRPCLCIVLGLAVAADAMTSLLALSKGNKPVKLHLARRVKTASRHCHNNSAHPNGGAYLCGKRAPTITTCADLCAAHTLHLPVLVRVARG